MNGSALKLITGACALGLVGFIATSAGLARATFHSTPISIQHRDSVNPAAAPPPQHEALPTGLRSVFYRALAEDAGATYAVNANGCATLSKQRLKACFDQRGAHFSGAGSHLALRLEGWGRAGDLESVHVTKPAIAGNRVNYTYDNVTEWWRVLPVGFEQGFTIAKRPVGHGKLTLALVASRRDAETHSIRHSRGKPVSEKAWGENPAKGKLALGKLRYGKLVVTDAKGNSIPATLKSRGDRILIAVNDKTAVYPLTVDPLVWLEQKVTASGGAAGEAFGYSVALDGTTALVGVYGAIVNGNHYQGAAYVFTDANGSWSEAQKLTASDGAAGDYFGVSVALDGATALIGAKNTSVDGNVQQGAIYVFADSNGSWSETQKVTASDGAAGDEFGGSIALDGTTAFVGAEYATVNGNSKQGAVYAFADSKGSWSETQKLTASDGAAGNEFGVSVALDNATALVGANGATVNGNAFQGAAYVFTDSNGSWSETQKLTASDGAAANLFGYSVALDDTTALVGAIFATVSGNGVEQGAVYVFTGSNGGWSETQKLTASKPGQLDEFGYSIALDGTTALVGALQSTVNGNARQGAVYVFTGSNGSWSEVQKLTASDGAAGDFFGNSVAFDGTTALVGAMDATGKSDVRQGAAYFYGERNLSLAVSVPAIVSQNEDYVSQVIATNNSSSSSPAVAVTVAVPAAASFVSATTAQGDCSETSDIVTCKFSQIYGNAGTATADVTLKATGDAREVIEETASVANATPLLRANATTRINTPSVAKDGFLETYRNKAADGVLKASDADDQPLTFIIVTPPAHGQVAINDVHKGFYTYTPTAGYVSGDSFTFKTNDGHDDSNVATVLIDVVNRPPVANDGSLATDKNTPANGMLQAHDPDGDSLVYSIVAPPGHGSILLNAETGTYIYTPAIDYFGADSFAFKVNDGQSDSDIATVSVTVKGSAPPPPPPPSNNDSGGGGFGALLLMLLAALTAMTVWLRNVGRKPIAFFRHVGAASAAIKKAAIAIDLRGLVHANRQTGRFGHKRKEMNMQVHGKWSTAVTGVLALVVIAGVSFVPISSAASGHTTAAVLHKSSGLTAQGIENARKTGLPGHFVTMAPQSNLGLLMRATKIGPHSLDSRIKLTVSLKLRNETKLKSFLEQVGNPASAIYHQWLTPAEFTQLYGPTKADVARVTAYLKARGIKIKDISSNRILIHTEASTAEYEQAFGIRINDYKLNGRSFYSTTDSPKIPRAIAPFIVSVLGLNHGQQMHSHIFQRPLMSAHDLSPREAPPASLTNLNPLQIAHAYNYPDITDATNGEGVNVAILTAVSSELANLSAPHDFWAAFGLPDHTINVIPVDGDNGGTGGMGETLLDVEYSGAMGPGITQNVYVAANTSLATFTDMYNQFANDTNPDGTAKNQVMTTSWGAPDTSFGQTAVADDQIFMQAASEGISMFAAAGDHGSSDGTGQDNVADYPSSSLYITSANGTQLNISDLAGDYGSEVVWNDADCLGNGHLATGGAVSRLFDKPDWQIGPGVPTDIDMRMNSDMAATASCTKPMLVFGTRWGLTAGTSAVAPQFAGLFAIAVAENGGPLGQSNELIYNVANSHYASDFHDVTEGNNGAFEAGPDWDHPTGWGSPNAQNLISHIGMPGPKGMLEGTVTDATGGTPIAGAVVMATGPGTSMNTYRATTDSDGAYSRVLPTGNFTVRVNSFGYADGAASIGISDGQTTTQDFALNPAPQATMAGEVTDYSGHGYGLYADIKVSTPNFGQVANVWTDPVTGKYSVKLPEGVTYTLNVAAAFDGYNTASKTVMLSGDKTQNFPLTATTTCTAPGYRFESGGFSEDFNASTFPPIGWTVAPSASTVTWMPSSQEPDFNGNYTGGTGDAAEANNSSWNSERAPYDTSLVTPSIPVTSLHGATLLRYKANYQNNLFDALNLDISTDEGATWTTIEHWTASHGAYLATPGMNVQVDLAQYLPTSGDFKLRWRYYSLRIGLGFYAQIDDVVIGRCGSIPGALVFGQVRAKDTGDGLVGATVTDEEGNTTTTIINRADPNFPIGGYEFFVGAGEHTLTARYYSNYHSDSASLNVVNNKIVTQDFALKAGRLSAAPSAFTMHVMVNDPAIASLTLKNTGSGGAGFKVWPINAPPPGSTQAAGPFAVTPHYAAKKDLTALTALGGSWHHSRFAPPIRRGIASHAAGNPVSHFAAGIPFYGLGVDHNASDLWLSSVSEGGLGGDDRDHRFLFDGTNTGDSIDVSSSGVLYMADMAFDDTTGTIWQLSVDGPKGSTSHIIELNPVTMTPTGNSILVPSPQSERGLAYDPLSNTWYAGDFNSMTIYHFNASGILLNSMDVGLPIAGLAYNSVTGHLFVLTSNGSHAIYVLDTKQDYIQVGSFDIDGFDPADAGAGLGYDCNGSLWLSGFVNDVVWQVDSGETGWCSEKGIPWLTLAPAGGSVATGTSTNLKLTFYGTAQNKFTTSHAYLSLASNTPYPNLIVPLTIIWDPQPVNLSLTGNVSPQPARKGDTLLYTLTVSNQHASNHGSATRVKLTYPLPEGASYTAASGDARCTAPPSGSAPTPASGGVPADTMTCDFGTIALGDSKAVTLAVKAADAGKLASHFKVSAREPDSDGSDNSLTLSSAVIGTANLALSAGKASIPAGGTGTLVLTLNNKGPDPASAVQIRAKLGGGAVHLQSASASQGQCSLSGSSVTCDLGQVDMGDPATVKLQLFGTSAGSATINAQASTASDEPDASGNGVTAQVTVTEAKSPTNNGSGGGAFGWLALAALSGLMVPALMRRRA